VPYNVVDELPAEVEQIVKPGKYRRFDLKIPVAAVFNPGRILLKLEGMPHWGRFLGLKSRQADTPEHASSAVRLLAITTDDVFYTFLVDTATSCGWEIRRAASLPEAIDLIRSYSIPLVILDWSDSAQDWRGELDRLCTGSSHPCVLLASEVMDDNLKGEVLRHRGYDVLPRFGDREQIVRLIQFAWFWTTRSRRLMEAETQRGKS
jgi:hypothetical protein